MRHLVCLATWSGEADALRVRFKLSSIAFSKRVATRSRSIQFLLLTFQWHENSESRFRSKVASNLAVSCWGVHLQTRSFPHQQFGRIQFPPANQTEVSRRTTGAHHQLLAMNVTTIVLINGLWISALSWVLWVQHYTDKGYRVIAADWPGRVGEIEQLRRDPSNFASLGLADVVDHYEQLIRELETPPIIIGHSFGGLVTQILLDRGWGAAGVAIAPAPVKGVRKLPLSGFKIPLSTLNSEE